MTRPSASATRLHRGVRGLPPWAPVAVLVLLSVGARLPGLCRSLWFDEVFYTPVTLSGDSLRDALLGDIHPPVYPLLMWGWCAIRDRPEFFLRLPSLVFGVGSVVLTFRLARRWLSTRTAFLAGVLLALSPAHIWYSQRNKNTVLAVLLAVAVATAAEAACRTGRRRAWVGFTALAVTACWTHVYASLFVFAALGWLWLEALRRDGLRSIRPVAIVTCAIGAAFLPVVIAAFRHPRILQPSYLRTFAAPEIYKLLLVYLSHGNTLRDITMRASWSELFARPAAALFVEGFYAAVLVAGIVAAVRCARRSSTARRGEKPSAGNAAVLVLLCVVVPILGVFAVSFVRPHSYIERSLLGLSPFWAMLVVAGVMSIPARRLRQTVLIFLFGLNAVAMYNLWIGKADQWTVYKPNPDWRSATQYMTGHVDDPNATFPVFASTPARTILYYDRTAVEHPSLPPPAPVAGRINVYYCGSENHAWVLADVLAAGEATTFFLVRNHVWRKGFDVLLQAADALPGWSLAQRKDFSNMSVYRYIRIDGAGESPPRGVGPSDGGAPGA